MAEVSIDYRIIIAGLICITAIAITKILCHDADTIVITGIVGVIALAMGIILPSPKIDNKTGVLRW